MKNYLLYSLVIIASGLNALDEVNSPFIKNLLTEVDTLIDQGDLRMAKEKLGWLKNNKSPKIQKLVADRKKALYSLRYFETELAPGDRAREMGNSKEAERIYKICLIRWKDNPLAVNICQKRLNSLKHTID